MDTWIHYSNQLKRIYIKLWFAHLEHLFENVNQVNYANALIQSRHELMTKSLVFRFVPIEISIIQILAELAIVKFIGILAEEFFTPKLFQLEFWGQSFEKNLQLKEDNKGPQMVLGGWKQKVMKLIKKRCVIKF